MVLPPGHGKRLDRTGPGSNHKSVFQQKATRHFGDWRTLVVIPRCAAGLAAYWCTICTRFPRLLDLGSKIHSTPDGQHGQRAQTDVLCTGSSSGRKRSYSATRRRRNAIGALIRQHWTLPRFISSQTAMTARLRNLRRLVAINARSCMRVHCHHTAMTHCFKRSIGSRSQSPLELSDCVFFSLAMVWRCWRDEAAALGLSDMIETRGVVPYAEVTQLQKCAHALLLLGLKP